MSFRAVSGGSRAELALTARGLINESTPLLAIGSTATSPTSQRIEGVGIGLKAGDVVTNIVVATTVGAAGTSPTTANHNLRTVALPTSGAGTFTFQ